MVQTGYVFLQNHGWVDTKMCDFCGRHQHRDHVGLWGPGNQLQDFWFCSHACVQEAMFYGVPPESLAALAERPPAEPERVHARAAWKLDQLARRAAAKKEADKQAKEITAAAKSEEKSKALPKSSLASNGVDLAPSTKKLCWADEVEAA